MFKANEQTEADMQSITAFLDAIQGGRRLTWFELQQGCGVLMNATGRDLVRRSLRRMKREYKPDHGIGIELSSADNGIEIVRIRDRRIGGAVKRARRASKRVVVHLEEMNESDRQEYLMRESLRNALATGSSSIRRLARRQEVTLPELPASSRDALERRKVS